MISVHFLGFKESFKKSISISIANRATAICHVSNKFKSDVLVVDIDNYDNLPKLEGLESKIIAISTVAFSNKKYRFTVPNKINFTQLIKFIQTIADEQLNVDGFKQSYKNSTIPIANYKSLDAELYLIGKIKRHFKQSKNKYILCSWDVKNWMMFDEENNKVYFGVKPAILKHFFYQKLEDVEPKLQVISDDNFNKLERLAMSSLNLELFLWKLVKNTLQGRLIQPLRMDERYFLKFFPDITQYANSTEELAMASLLSNSSATIDETSKSLNVSIKKVISFVSCCYYSGFIEIKDNNKPTPPKQNQKKYKSSKFIKMILRKIHIK